MTAHPAHIHSLMSIEYETSGPNYSVTRLSKTQVELGPDILWDAFQSYRAGYNSNLELRCIGVGAPDAIKPEHPRTRHLSFVQPAEIRERLAGGRIFLLPSNLEPGGLVVKEFPLVLSSRVDAADRLLGDDNGFPLPKGTADTLVRAIKRIDALSAEELAAMSCASRAMAEGRTVDDWARQATAFLEGRA